VTKGKQPSLRTLTNGGSEKGLGSMIGNALSLVKHAQNHIQKEMLVKNLKIMGTLNDCETFLEGLNAQLNKTAKSKSTIFEKMWLIERSMRYVHKAFRHSINVCKEFESSKEVMDIYHQLFTNKENSKCQIETIYQHLYELHTLTVFEKSDVDKLNELRGPLKTTENPDDLKCYTLGTAEQHLRKFAKEADPISKMSRKHIWSPMFGGCLVLGAILAGRFIGPRFRITWIR
jgi:hypothetical protein